MVRFHYAWGFYDGRAETESGRVPIWPHPRVCRQHSPGSGRAGEAFAGEVRPQMGDSLLESEPAQSQHDIALGTALSEERQQARSPVSPGEKRQRPVTRIGSGDRSGLGRAAASTAGTDGYRFGQTDAGAQTNH